MGFMVLPKFDCVLNWFYHVVDISLCCMGFINLLISDCVLRGFYCFVRI